MTYDFQPYDVLQINRRGEWMDFSTLRDSNDARRAVQIVTSGKWDGETFAFRIVRRDSVVFSVNR